MLKNNAIKNLFYIAVLTAVVSITWIASSVYYGLVTSTIPEDTLKYATPIDPSFDTATLNQIGDRVSVPINFSTKGRYQLEGDDQESASSSSELEPEELNRVPVSTDSPVVSPIVPSQQLPDTESGL